MLSSTGDIFPKDTKSFFQKIQDVQINHIHTLQMFNMEQFKFTMKYEYFHIFHQLELSKIIMESFISIIL